MSPTSLANHRLSITPNKNLLPTPTPLLQKLLAYLNSRAGSRRARSVVLFFVALLALYRWSGTSELPFAPHPTSPSAFPSTSSLQFPPDEVARPSAEVRYKEGVTQIIELHDEPQRLWGEAIEGVDIPLGLTVTLLGDEAQGGGPVQEMQRGSNSTGTVCEGAKKAVLRQDIRVGLQQLREAEPDEELVLTLPTLFPWSRTDDITLVTQFSVSRLSRFERTLAAWNGPMSITIYLTDPEDIYILQEHLANPENRRRWKKIAVTVVKPSYAPEAVVERLRYPINRLRNLALTLAPTWFTLVIDADFLPSPRMHSILQAHALPLFIRSESASLHRTAVIISAFALSASYPPTQPFPSTTAALWTALNSKPPLASLTDRNAGHGPSLPSLFLSTSLSHSATYEICYEPQYEPYYLLHTPSHLLYDERFTDQGGDKQSHALKLNALGYRFFGLRGAWVMHPPRGSAHEAIDESWPSARLSAPSQDPSHFNVQAQKDTQRYRYFQDYLPEMEKEFGRNVRYPAGCGAGQLGRMFGRGRSATIWGL